MVRIDDRLIHGQVIAGWCPQINPDHLVLCNDEVAANEWECELYHDAASGYKTSICSVDGTVCLLRRQETKHERVFLIVESPHVIVRLVEQGIHPETVIVGGMHYQPGKRKVTDFIYIDDDDLRNFQFLVNRNIKLEAKNVPSGKAIDLEERLGLTKNNAC